MSGYHKSSEKKHIDDFDSHDQDVVGSLCSLGDRAGSPNMHVDQEKRMRREIANSNERRRMQSINAGFQSLRTLLPHHEGEKLSKAAILQQTAEYIYTLEQEKTRLLSQNCQLKRIINQHEGEASTNVKKRKTESGPVTVLPAAVSESSDEGIGSMSPEPVSMGTGASGCGSDQDSSEILRREVMELRVHLERERRMRLSLEEQVRSLESQPYVQPVQLQYHHEVAPWAEEQPVEDEEVDPLQAMLHQPVVEREGPPPRRESQCSSHSGSRLLHDEDASVAQLQTSAIMATPTIIFPEAAMSPLPLSLPVASPCPSPVPSTILGGPVSPPLDSQPRIPSVLEAAIKAEPKVEVERLPSPSLPTEDSPQTRLYIANTSRQNLETIVEAIRHLEGDHLFSDDPSPHRQGPSSAPNPILGNLPEKMEDCSETEAQDMPLALTTTSRAMSQQSTDHQRILKMKVDPFPYQRTSLQQQQQHRPGVIVVKQHT